MNEPVYSIVTTRPASEPFACQSKRCGRVIGRDEAIHLVYHRWRFMRDPAADDNRAYLCVRCVGRLGDRAGLADPPPLPPLGPFSYGGKPVPAF